MHRFHHAIRTANASKVIDLEAGNVAKMREKSGDGLKPAAQIDVGLRCRDAVHVPDQDPHYYRYEIPLQRLSGIASR